MKTRLWSVMSAILNCIVSKTHCSSGDCSASSLKKKNRNIKANDVNLISMARSIDFCFKTMYVSMFLCFRFILRCFQCFVHGSSPFGKLLPMNSPPPPYPLEIMVFEPPSPLEFPRIFRGGDWIFSGTTHSHLC